MTSTNILKTSEFAPVLADYPIRCIDIGSRGGIEPKLLPVAFGTEATGFEPDADECRRLNSQPSEPWKSVQYHPIAIGETSGSAQIHLTEAEVSASLMVPNRDIGKRFDKMSFCNVLGKTEVDVLDLDSAMSRFAIDAPDIIKLDIEGPELGCLKAAGKALSGAAAVITEVGFLHLRLGQPLMRDMDAFMSDQGFELLDIIEPTHWRKHGHRIHPFISREKIPYSRGQLIQADLIYMRSPSSRITDTDPGKSVRSAGIAMALGYFDRAEEYLSPDGVRSLLRDSYGISVVRALRTASLAYGRAAWRDAFYRQVRGTVSLLRQRALRAPRRGGD